MDLTAQAILVGAISGGIVAILGAIGLFIINQRASQGSAKQTDITRLEASYSKLQATYEAANARLNTELESERNARRSDKLECQTQIDGLQRQLTVLLTKMPEPGALTPVIIAGVDKNVVALPVSLSPTTLDKDGNPATPVIIKGPIPLPMTAAQVAQAAAEIKSGEIQSETPKE